MKKIALIVFLLFITLQAHAQWPESFELPNPGTTWTFQSGEWTVVNVAGSKTWERKQATTQIPSHSGSYVAYLDKENVAPTDAIPEDWLITPQIDLAGMTTPELRFFSRMVLTGDQGGVYKVMVSTTTPNTAAFTQLKSWSETELNPVQNAYNEEVVNLTAFAGSKIYLAFVMIGKDKDRWMIDDVAVGDKCFPVSNLTATTTPTTASLSWSSPSGVTQWEVEVVTDNGALTGTGSITSVNSNYIVSSTTAGASIQPNTAYRYYVRSVCGAIKSTWTGPYFFVTKGAGDTCSNPIVIPGELPYVSINQSYKAISYFTGYPGSGCGVGSAEFQGAVYTVYSYTAINNGLLNVSFNPNENSAAVFIYGSCNDIGVNCLAGSANTSNLVKNIKDFPLNQGATYYIVVASKKGSLDSHYSLALSINNGCSPLEASFVINSDCGPNSTYNAIANITEMGGGTSVLATLYKNGVASGSQLIGNPGAITFTSIGSNDIATILLQSNQNHNCLLLSNELSKELCPPVNDACANATVIVPSIQGYCNATKGKLSSATASPEISNCPGVENDDVWYQFTALGAKHVISIMDITGNDVNLNHALYQGNACGSLVQLYCDEDNYSIADNLVAGQTYKIRVYSDAATPANTTFEICTIGFPYTCMETNPQSAIVKNLFKDLINYLNSLDGSQTEPFDCPQLTALAPYISDPNPKIYNFHKNPQGGSMGFSFSDNTVTSDVSIHNPSSQVATDINFYTYVSPEHEEPLFITYANGSTHDKGNYVRHINFCPDPQCPALEGYIKINPGMSCMVVGQKHGFSLVTDVTDITSYVWAFYDSQMQIVGTSLQAMPVMKFDTVGTYTAKLTVTQTNGCKTYIDKVFSVRTTCSDLCTETNPQTAVIKGLYIDFINYLFDYLNQGNVISNGFTCPQLAALAPYIENNYNKIYNVSYTNGTLSFSFWNGGPTAISVKNNGHITDIDLTGHTDAYTGVNYPTKYLNNSILMNHYIKSIYFCGYICPSADGFIGLSEGMSCAIKNKPVGLKLDADIPGITSYNWTTSGGVISGSNTATPTITFNQSIGNYTINLQITYNNNCTATFYKTIYVGAEACTGCTETNIQSATVKKLYIDLINYLATFGSNVPTTPFTCPQLEALAPYITDNNPMIWNMNYSGSNLRFSFSNHGTEYDVSVNTAYGKIVDIELLYYTSFLAANDLTVRYKGGATYGHTVRHVDFCPASSTCPDLQGTIKMDSGLSCVPLNIEQGFSLQTVSSTIEKYEWTFYNTTGGVLTTSTLVKPVMVYNTTGNFLIKLVVTDNTGCQSSFYKTVTVSASCGDSCTEANEESAAIEQLFKILVNKLFNVGTGLTNGYTCPELLDLAPFITDPSPAIYNPVFTNNGLTLSFSFSLVDSQPDVVVSKLGTILDINLVNFASAGSTTTYITTYKRGAQSFTNTVKHINFCPPVVPCESHVAFVVDESTSIDETEASDIRVQLQQFINQQKDSGMIVSLIGMSDSDVDTRRDHITDKVDASTIDAFTNWIKNYKKGYSATDINLGNSPNSDFWASGLKRAYYSDLKPEMIIVLTDGSQTADVNGLKEIVQLIDNDPETHLYFYGIGEGSYVDSETDYNQLVYNSGMEIFNPWPMLTDHPAGAADLLLCDSSKSHEGTYSLKLTTPQWANPQVSYVETRAIVNINNPVATRYIYSGWIFAAQNPGQITFFTYTPGIAGYSAYQSTASTTIGSWQYVEGSFIVPAAARRLSLRVDNLGLGDVWFDDLKIIKQPLNTTFGEEVFSSTLETVGEWPTVASCPLPLELISYDTANSYTGSASLKIHHPGGYPEVCIHSTKEIETNITEPTQYTYSAWVKNESSPAEIVVVNPNGGEWVNHMDINPTQGWHYVEKTFTISPGVTKLNLRLDNNGPGDVWFDDVKIMKKGGSSSAAQTDQVIYTDNLEITSFPDTAAYPGGAPVLFDTSKSHSGTYSLKLANPSNLGAPASFVHANEHINIHNDVTTQYKYSGWVYTDENPAQLTLFMTTDTETGYFTYVTSVASTKKGTWQYLEGTFNVPADIHWLNLRVDNLGVGDVWFDDLKIVKPVVNTNSNNYDQTIYTSNMDAPVEWPSAASYPPGEQLISSDTSKGHSNDTSLKIHSNGTTPEVYVFSTKYVAINNAEATEYTYSGWIYNQSQAPAQIWLFMYTQDGAQAYVPLLDGLPQVVGWQYVEKTLLVPANIRNLMLRLDNNGTGDVWFDDLKIVQKAAVYNSGYDYTVFKGNMENADEWPSIAEHPYGQQLISYDTSKVHSGGSSLKIHHDGSTSEVYVRKTGLVYIDNSQAAEYRFSGWVFNEAASAEIHLFKYTENNVISIESLEALPAEGWHYVEKIILVPAGIVALNLRLDNNGAGDVWFDDLKIVKVATTAATNVSPDAEDLPAEVTTRLKTSLKFLLDLPVSEFPVSNNVDLLEGIYYEYESFANLSNPRYERYFSNKLAEANIGCEGESIPFDYCQDCETFQPIPENAYWISAWIKEENNIQVKEYKNGVINLVFSDSGKRKLSTITLEPSGDIIDGWQRVAAKFIIPKNTSMMDIELENLSASIPVYFDDIRVHPFKGSMKSFVYDPETFKLMAEQDDNNYSTFYEYDKEGGLIRIKKETSKGIKTIQESRSGTVIKPSN